jgi:hypothetical protein
MNEYVCCDQDERTRFALEMGLAGGYEAAKHLRRLLFGRAVATALRLASSQQSGRLVREAGSLLLLVKR